MFKILLAVDGSDHAQRTIDKTIELAAALRSATVHVLNVQEEPLVYGEIAAYMPPEKAQQLAKEAGEAIAAAAAQRLQKSGLVPSSEAVIGNIAQTIVDRARDLECNLIVMGTRGMGAIGTLVLGSVANKVVHLTHVPVMLVH